MKHARRQQGRTAFDLIEEATHLLRTAPAATLAAYYLGAIPFVLGLLYFWADMSRSPFAGRHLADSALGLAALFVWMKFWQVIFARHLRSQVAAEPAPRWTLRRWGRVFLTQAFVQPSGLFVVPLSLIPMLPAAWVYAFYQNVTALDDGGPAGISPLLKKSWKQALLWPGQNHLALAILSGFGFYVFLNWAVTGLMLPHLVKMLFGIESAFTRSTFSLLNTTFFAGMLGLTYLCVDPILKTVYLLRCFYGESLESGEDLRAELTSAAGRRHRWPSSPFCCWDCGARHQSVRPTRPRPLHHPLRRRFQRRSHRRSWTGQSTGPSTRTNTPGACRGKKSWRRTRRKAWSLNSSTRRWPCCGSGPGPLPTGWTNGGRNFSRTRRPTPGPGPPVTAGSSRCKSCFTDWWPLVLAALAVMLYRVWRNRQGARPRRQRTHPAGAGHQR